MDPQRPSSSSSSSTVKPLNPLHLLQTQTQTKLPLGCPILTRLLAGGLTVGTVTEISGESSSGKTQLSLQLLLSSPSPSLFIHSEFPFPLRRLLSLSLSRPHPGPNPLDRILVAGAHSPADLLALLSRAESSSLLSSVKLVVVDSIAALFRSEFGSSARDLKRRSELFFRIAARLKEVARDFELAVVVTNQVVDVIDGENAIRVGNYGVLRSSGRRVSPAMGISWANCVNLRLFLSREEEEVVRGGEEEEVVRGGEEGFDQGFDEIARRTTRRIQVVFAPHLPEASAEFVIVKEGVFGVSL